MTDTKSQARPRPAYAAGDDLVMVTGHQQTQTVTVLKVARKYVTTTHPHGFVDETVRFDIETGKAANRASAFWNSRVLTAQAWATELEHRAEVDRLRGHNDFVRDRARHLPLQDLQRLNDLLDELSNRPLEA